MPYPLDQRILTQANNSKEALNICIKAKEPNVDWCELIMGSGAIGKIGVKYVGGQWHCMLGIKALSLALAAFPSPSVFCDKQAEEELF